MDREEESMSKTPESKVKDKVKAVLDSYGAYWFMPPANGFGRSGIPDFIACHRGRFLAVECKAAGGQPTALQNRELFRIRQRQGTALIVTDDPNTLAVLDLWLKSSVEL